MEGLCKQTKTKKEKNWRVCLLWMHVLLIACAMIYFDHKCDMHTVQAESANGTWGTCTWTLSEEGVLTVSSGTGVDVDWVSSSERHYGTPWVDHSDDIKEMVFGSDGTVVFPKKCSDMFKAYKACEKIVFFNVDTSAVTDMENMFEDCEKLQSIEGLNQFDTKQVEDMENFFSNCTMLKVADLSSFDTACIQERNNYNLNDFFDGNNALEKIIFGEHFSFSDAYIQLPENTNWYKEGAQDKLIDYDQLSSAEGKGDITLSGTWLRAEGFYWGECKCTINDHTLTVGAGKGSDRHNKFYSPWKDYAEEIEYIKFEDGVIFPEDIHELFRELAYLKEIDFSNVDMSKVKNAVSLFGDCTNLKTVSLNAKVPAQPTNLTQAFSCCYTLESVKLGNFDTSKVEYFNSFFYECYNLQSFEFDQVDISSAKYMGNMFQECYRLREADLSSWKSDSVMDISSMFSLCSSLTKVILPEQGIHIGMVNSAYGSSATFYKCTSLTSIENLNKLDTSKVEYMDGMFYGCKNLTALNLSSFDTSNVKKIHQMFYGCESLTELDLSTFDTTHMETYNIIDGTYNYSMYQMFDGCDNLAKVIVGDQFVFQGGRSTKYRGWTVAQSGSLPENQVNPEHVDEWYIYQSDVDGEAGQWVSNYGTDSGITDLTPAKRTFTKYENGTIIEPKKRINFGDLQLTSNIKEQYEYTGQELRPEEGNTILTAVIDENEVVLQEGVDYEVRYPAQSYYIGAYGLVHFDGIGDYCGEYTAVYYVCKGTKVNIDSCVEWPGDYLKYTYTGSEIRPVPKSVMDGEKQLIEGQDYVLEYVNNTNVGQYSSSMAHVYIYGKGDYVGSSSWSFTIKPKNINSGDITAVLQEGKYLYTGSEVRPTDITVKDGDVVLKEGTDYELSYWNNTKLGDEARVDVHGIGNYDGYKYVFFTIVDNTGGQPEQNPQQPSEPTPSDPAPVNPVPADNTNPANNNNTQVTTEQTTQADTTETSGTIVQQLQKVRFKAGKKSIKVSWKKTGNIAGMEVQYALSGKKKMKWKTVSVSKAKSAVTIRKLKKKKKYVVRIRCYQTETIDNKAVKQYSDWIQKTIKTK